MQDQNAEEWVAPPPTDTPDTTPKPEMSEVSTLFNIFFEPGRTFEDLRRKPRFIMGAILIAILATGYAYGLYYKFGDAGIRRAVVEAFDKNPQTQNMPPDQKAGAVNMQMTITSYARMATPLIVFIVLLIGGLLYFGAAKAFGGSGNFKHALSVWIYSSIPPSIVGMIANAIVMIFKSADDIDLATSQKGLITANPSFFIDGKAHPIIGTLISTLDLFAIWGWILAAIGLRHTNRISSGAAWGIVILIKLIGLAFRLVGAMLSGNVS